MPPKTRGKKIPPPLGLTEDETAFVDHSDTDEDVALLIPRLGDLTRGSGEKAPPSTRLRNQGGKVAGVESDEGGTPRTVWSSGKAR